MAFTTIQEALEFAIDKEKEAVAFYNEISKREQIADLAVTFKELAQEEARHVRLLTSISQNPENITARTQPSVSNLMISDYLVEVEYSAGMPMQDVLILAMKREEKAFQLYNKLASQATGSELVDLFRMLANEEAQHKNTFERMYDDYQAKLGN